VMTAGVTNQSKYSAAAIAMPKAMQVLIAVFTAVASQVIDSNLALWKVGVVLRRGLSGRIDSD
jgi:hypothetical protein